MIHPIDLALLLYMANNLLYLAVYLVISMSRKSKVITGLEIILILAFGGVLGLMSFFVMLAERTLNSYNKFIKSLKFL